jgi:hypothetical protein
MRENIKINLREIDLDGRSECNLLIILPKYGLRYYGAPFGFLLQNLLGGSSTVNILGSISSLLCSFCLQATDFVNTIRKVHIWQNDIIALFNILV